MVSRLVEAKKILSAKEFDKFKLSVARHGKNHGNAMSTARADIKGFIFMMSPDANTAQAVWGAVDDFLTARAGVNWLSNELGVIT